MLSIKLYFIIMKYICVVVRTGSNNFVTHDIDTLPRVFFFRSHDIIIWRKVPRIYPHLSTIMTSLTARRAGGPKHSVKAHHT